MRIRNIPYYFALVFFGLSISLYHPYILAVFNANYIGKYPTVYPTNIDNNSYLKQNKNNCGPFVVATLLQLEEAKNHKPNYVIENITFRVPNEFTLPIGISKFMKKEGFKTRELNLLNDSYLKKMALLKLNS